MFPLTKAATRYKNYFIIDVGRGLLPTELS